ncbi:MAG: LysM peptidoglycan-binding domain-containing protein [Deltaproteobacteria bacterium]|nr:LysM peptidoglycan-binding domain-containing protein [Deltaproteobacteria bacterium]
MTLMSATRAAAVRVTADLDGAASSMFGGKLEKAMFVVFKAKNNDLSVTDPEELPFYINPNTVKIDKEVEFKEDPANNGTVNLKFSQTKPICLSVGELWFDTYDTRESVRGKYVDKLERLMDYEKDTHVVNVLKFVWGEFGKDSKCDDTYTFALSKLSVEYTLFLPSGMPCRAKVSLCLQQVVTHEKIAKWKPKESPDHAKIYTVKRGDTLQGISRHAYDDPREWRRIALTNGIDDPMNLRPGQKLLLPPILR